MNEVYGIFILTGTDKKYFNLLTYTKCGKVKLIQFLNLNIFSSVGNSFSLFGIKIK